MDMTTGIIIGLALATVILVLYIRNKKEIEKVKLGIEDLIEEIEKITDVTKFDINKYQTEVQDLLPSFIKDYETIVSDVTNIVNDFNKIKLTDVQSLTAQKDKFTTRLKSIEFTLSKLWITKI